ncbi:MAG: hypothetical protein M1837_003392 [Sclerophora amabilis]|nr:MAG: hypothetical protein M1837_003392 [Sclerophora amabilis]
MPGDDVRLSPKQDHHRFLTKGHWKAKILSKNDQVQKPPGHQKPGADDEVTSFLNPSAKHPSAQAQNGSLPQQLGRIDTSAAQRWPTASELKNLAGSHLAEPGSRPPPQRPPERPKRRRKGLSVRFAETFPELIGEGGDEAEEPTQEISLRRARSTRHGEQERTRPDFDTRRLGRPPASEQEPPRDPIGSTGVGRVTDGPTRPKMIQRAPTGPGETLGLKEGLATPLELDGYGTTFMSPVTSLAGNGTTSARPSIPPKGSNESFAKAQARMRAEEGRAFTSPPPPSPLPTSVDGRAKTFFDDGAHLPHQTESSSRPSLDKSASHSAVPLIQTSASQNPPPGLSPQRSKSGSGQPVPVPIREQLPLPLRTYSSARPGSSSSDVVPAELEQPVTFPIREQLPVPLPKHQNARPGSSGSDMFPPLQAGTSSTTANDALKEFSSRTQHLHYHFEHAAESVKPIFETSFLGWIRAALWWFLKGRVSLEATIRSQKASQSTTQPPYQAYADLAKADWIVQQISSEHPEPRRYGAGEMSATIEVAKRNGDEQMANVLEMHQALVKNLRGVTMSMKKNALLPPNLEQSPATQRLDLQIWIDYPLFTPEICALLSGPSAKPLVLQSPSSATSRLEEAMPLSDTGRRFCYGRMFVDAFLVEETGGAEVHRIPCILSMLRDRKEMSLTVVLTSQNDLVNISIQSRKKYGPTWNEVIWKTKQQQIYVKLPRDITLSVQMNERDYIMLRDILAHTEYVFDSARPRPNEDLLSEIVPKSFQYVDSQPRSNKFPTEPISQCEVRLFERTLPHTDGHGTRRLHRGYRLMAITRPSAKHLNSVSHELGRQTPIEFGFLRSEEGDPALLLRPGSEDGRASMLLTFNVVAERATFLSSLQGVRISRDECCLARVPLMSFSIIDASLRSDHGELHQHSALGDFGWQQIQVVNKTGSNSDNEFGGHTLSEHLRLCADSKLGTIVDRINLSPGQLLLELDPAMTPTLKVLRSSQEDLTISIAENLIPDHLRRAVKEVQQTILTSTTIRTFMFHSLPDLHSFQAAMTGFTVLFDGIASTFAISRRRMVVPIYKRWETNGARIQVLRQDKVVQLVAFFENFSHGRCMNFQLKGTDRYDSLAKSGKFITRLVDAKFALPKGEESESRDFVCLDMPEYPGEHDDINISFDAESDQAMFHNSLPAPVENSKR